MLTNYGLQKRNVVIKPISRAKLKLTQAMWLWRECEIDLSDLLK